MKKELNKSGIYICPVGFGAMPLSIHNRPSFSVSYELLKTFLDLGGDFIDTANVYALNDGDIGHNEKLISNALRQLGVSNKVHIATKGGLRRPDGEWTSDASPAFLRESCEKSLTDLGVDEIFLYYLHAPDPNVPFMDSVETLQELKDEGKILNIGLSNVSLQQIKKASEAIEIFSIQNRLHPFHKVDFNNGVIEYCTDHNMTYFAYSPIGGGNGHNVVISHPTLDSIAKKHSITPAQVSLAWMMECSAHIVPIPGTRHINRLQENMMSVKVHLDSDEIEQINKLADWY